MQSRHSQEKHILVVDDNPDILDFLHDLLESEGYTVAVNSKVDYLEKLQNGGLPDLILLDVFLSGKDGREIVKSLKNQEETKKIPVIMFSAHPSAEATARAAGADDFLAKPFDLDELLKKVTHYL
jgi:CheY-like chemotaxis protein